MARTIADLKEQDAIDAACLLEASSYGPISSAADAGASCRFEKRNNTFPTASAPEPAATAPKARFAPLIALAFATAALWPAR